MHNCNVVHAAFVLNVFFVILLIFVFVCKNDIVLYAKVSNIAKFLKENFKNTSTVVAIFEEEEPHYIIASSTGVNSAKQVLASDTTQPCPDVNSDQCTAQRVTMTELSDISHTPIDRIMSDIIVQQKENGFSHSNFVTVKADVGDSVYVSLTQPFRLPDVNLNWIVIIMSPT